MTHLIFRASPWWLIAILAAILILAIEVPYRWRNVLRADFGENRDAFTVLQAGLLTLASFVLGLSFSQAQGRFDARRELVVKEANAIGTTWLRADQLAPPARERFRQTLTDYTATRLQAYEVRPNGTRARDAGYRSAVARSAHDQDLLWVTASSALREHPADLGLSLLMASVNDTIDVSGEQLQALTTHVPTAVVELTLLLIVLAAFSCGLRFAVDGARPAALSAVFIVASVIVVTMMVDYDRPQSGFVRVNLNPLRLQLASMQPDQAAQGAGETIEQP